MRLKITFITAFIFVTSFAYAQITSATINGKVTDGQKPIAGANITMIYLPTNTVFETLTDKKGRFSLDNLDVGGPYRIIVKNTEIENYIKSGVQLSLGDNDLQKDIIVSRKENLNQNVALSAETFTQ